MEINKRCKVSSGDFWYDLTDGGYLDVYKICKNKEDAERVKNAIEVVKEFQSSCEEQIEDFVQ